jgi:hypothetical protein
MRCCGVAPGAAGAAWSRLNAQRARQQQMTLGKYQPRQVEGAASSCQSASTAPGHAVRRASMNITDQRRA